MTNETSDDGQELNQVRQDELKYLTERRRLLYGTSEQEQVGKSLVGLALSGGGIRSATTNLGVLQGLARMGILPLVDYLCTVSGGGYIGGCLSALLSVNKASKEGGPWQPGQHEMAQPADALFTTEWNRFPFRDEPGQWPASGRAEVKQLRTHGNFLIARKGFFTTETLRSIGGVLTGIAYHWLLFLLALAFLGALCLWVTLGFLAPGTEESLKQVVEIRSGADTANGQAPSPPTVWQRLSARISPLHPAAAALFKRLGDRSSPFVLGAIYGAVLALPFFIFVWLAMPLLAVSQRWATPKEGESPEDAFHRRLLQWIRRSARTSLAAGRRWADPKAGESLEDAFHRRLLKWVRRSALGAIVIVVVILRLQYAPYARQTMAESLVWLFLPLVVTLSFWAASFTLYVLLPWGEIVAWRPPPRGAAWLQFWSRQFRTSWGSVQALATYWVVGAAGLMLFPFLVYAVWDVGILALVPPLVSALASRGLVTRLGGIPGVPSWLSPRLKNALLGVLVGIFIVLMVLTLAAWFVDWERYNFLSIAIIAVVLLCLVGVIGNANKIGLHYFYRDRLIETYLRTEVTNPQLTLDLKHDAMDMRLKDLHGVPPAVDEHKPDDYRRCVSTAPYLLVSTALNIAERRDLTRKDRKSGYFIFSKLYCGSYHTNFRRTNEYQAGEVKLARAMTISGAAVGSGMGYQTFFAQAFATTLFNLRLGYWMENPGKPPRFLRDRTERPIFSPWYLLKEMFSWTHARGHLVNLSDGGHTGDNVGIYPLLQRRCQVIIACDAEADPKLAFGSFTEALRHAYVDMNIDVDIDLTMIRPDPVTGLSRSHCAVGRIRYPPPECGELPPPPEAWLIYLKNSLIGDEPEPVKNYWVAHPDFPHETTADQFFDDAQFESYRALGDHLVEHTFEPALRQLPPQQPLYKQPPSVEWLRYLQTHHSSFKAADDPDYRQANQRLSQLEGLLAGDPLLRWYYEECYMPADRRTTPRPQSLPPSLSRVSLEQARLMEYVFVTLNLGRHGNAPDNRGWMNLFRSWARSETFQVEFDKIRRMFTKEFEEFYNQYIMIMKQDDIDEKSIPHPWDQEKPPGVKGVYLDPGRREARA